MEEACMLCKILTPTLLDAHQIEGFDTRYKKKIAFLLDGTVVGVRAARKNSLLTRSTWSKKSMDNKGGALTPLAPAQTTRLHHGAPSHVAIATTTKPHAGHL